MRMSDREEERGQHVTPLELFFDLVFVFAITQVTSFLSESPTWDGLLRVCWCWARCGGRGLATRG
jgi:low temperature requirement protein LtrA